MKGHYGDAPAVSAEGGGGSEWSNSFTPLQNKNKDLLRSHFFHRDSQDKHFSDWLK